MTFANAILNVDDFNLISGGGSIALLSRADTERERGGGVQG